MIPLRLHLVGLKAEPPLLAPGADTPVPPSLCPRMPNEEPPPGAASLTAFSTADVSAGGLAPLIVSITEPLRRIRKVGMALTPYCCETSLWLSTSTLQNVILLGLAYLVARESKVGAIILHGPHQSA